MILVTGANGFVGSALCRYLIEKSLSVCGTDMCPNGSANLFKSFFVGNIDAKTDWTNVLKGVDAIVHLAARVHIMRDTISDPLGEFRKTNVEGTRHLAESAARAGVRHFVFLSSVKVNGEITPDKAFIENDLPRPEDPYAVSKWEAEQVLRQIEQETGMAVTILRPPLIYGPGVKANFFKLVQAVDRGIPLPFGGIHNLRSLIGLTNLIDIIYSCLTHPSVKGKTYLVGDGMDVSTPELIRKIGVSLKRSARLIFLPGPFMRLAGLLTGKSAQIKRLCGSLRVDTSCLRKDLGWTPTCTMDEELVKLANWYKNLRG